MIGRKRVHEQVFCGYTSKMRPHLGFLAGLGALLACSSGPSGGSDGGNPQGGLIISGGGVLYGTTYAGGTGLACSGGCGTVFSLVP